MMDQLDRRARPERSPRMDADRFDTLTRSLTDARSRRSALGKLLGGTLGLLGLAGTAAKKRRKKGGKKKRKKRRDRRTPPPPTCIDGIKNGSESDVDCGGTCPRCANGQRCLSRNDCAGALCVSGTCQACTADADCGSDAAGACVCVTPAAGEPKVCASRFVTGAVDDCALCPPGDFCLPPDLVGGSVRCAKLCGAP